MKPFCLVDVVGAEWLQCTQRQDKLHELFEASTLTAVCTLSSSIAINHGLR